MTPDNFRGLKPEETEVGRVHAETKNWSEEFFSTLDTLEKQNSEFAGALAGLLPADHEKFEQMLNSEDSGAYGWQALPKLNKAQQDSILELMRDDLSEENLAEIAKIISE